MIPVMLAQTEIVHTETLLERFGAYSLILILIALAFGIVALIKRKPNYNLFAGIGILSVVLLAFGCTAWRIHEMTIALKPYGTPDPAMAFMDTSWAWRISGVVLPVCGLSGILLAMACLSTKPDEKS